MAKLVDLKALAADLRKRLRQVDQLTGRGNERDRDATRKRQVRTASKEVQIPLCENWDRRAQLEADDTAWLRHYFHELFWYPFTTQQLEMIEAIRSAIRYGGDQAIATFPRAATAASAEVDGSVARLTAKATTGWRARNSGRYPSGRRSRRALIPRY